MLIQLQNIVAGIVIPPNKIPKYALNTNHPIGGDKAYMFQRHLGYTKDNYSFLEQQIKEKALTANAVERQPNDYGRIFQVDIEILGNYQGQKETVRTGWIVKPNSNLAQLTTLYIIER
ncbi:MAG: hypothetical protein QNJ42_08130 [Crocosphaera sp.]|nr:hypothetical protein [Crocosphaera sp.]